MKKHLCVSFLWFSLLLLLGQYACTESLPNHTVLPDTAHWIPEKSRLLCYDYSQKGNDSILIFDIKSKTYKFCQLPNIKTTLFLSPLSYINSTEEIVLSTYQEDYAEIIKVYPFGDNPEIKAVYHYTDYISKKYDGEYIEDMKVLGNTLLLNCEKTDDLSFKYYTLLAFDINSKEFSLVSSDVRSSKLYKTESGNVYFLSRKGLQRLIKDSTKLEMVISSKNIESVTEKWGWKHCDVNSVYISPDETIGILVLGIYHSVDSQEHSGKEFCMACSFDLIASKCTGRVSNKEHSIFYTTRIHFTPDSKRIFLDTYRKNKKMIEIYDTSLKKSSTLFENSGSIMSCGKEGFIRIERFPKETNSNEFPFDFLMYTWDGELLFKFKHQETIEEKK